MKSLTLGAVLLLMVSGISCSTIEKMQSTTSERREFQTRNVWVKRTTAKDNLGFRKINRMKPLLYKTLVIQGNGLDGIIAYEQESGAQVWRLDVTNGVEASAAIINDKIFFGGNDGQFYSVYADTGSVIWTFPTRTETLSEPLIDNGNVYFLTGNNSLYALDAATGKQVWLYSRQDPSSISVRGGSKPALRNGTLYVGFSDGALVAVVAGTGTVKWEKQLNRNKKFRDLDSDPVLEGEYLYIVGFDDHIYCVRAATGDQVWKSEQGGYGRPLVQGDRVYYSTTNNQLMALNKETGNKIWALDTKDGIATSPTFYKGLVVYGESQGLLNFVDALSGKKISSFEPGRGILSQSTVDEKTSRVYFISNEANIYSLEAKWDYPHHIKYLE